MLYNVCVVNNTELGCYACRVHIRNESFYGIGAIPIIAKRSGEQNVHTQDESRLSKCDVRCAETLIRYRGIAKW